MWIKINAGRSLGATVLSSQQQLFCYDGWGPKIMIENNKYYIFTWNRNQYLEALVLPKRKLTMGDFWEVAKNLNSELHFFA